MRPVEGEDPGNRNLQPAGALQERPTLRARWYSLPGAGRVLGVSESVIRRQIADGALTSIRAGRGRRVLIVGDPPGVEGTPTREPESASRQEDNAAVLAQTSESLSVLVRDLQRQSLALAGQIGYLQHQLSEAQDQVRLLTDRQGATVNGTETGSQREEAHQQVLREITSLRETVERLQAPAELSAKRRWWWRR